MIKLEDVSKEFKDIVLFKKLNIEFHPSKFNVIVGENGSGKSVLMRMLVGFSRPKTGKISVDEGVLGETFDFLPHSGVSINSPEFIGYMTGRENIKLLSNIKKCVNQDYLDTLIQRLSMDKNIDKLYRKYSMGMKQKLRIIQALMENPKYIVLDEPFDGLDQDSVEEVIKILKDQVSKGKTLIVSTHSSDIIKHADVVYKVDSKEKTVDVSNIKP